jgi:hypothetical protein
MLIVKKRFRMKVHILDTIVAMVTERLWNEQRLTRSIDGENQWLSCRCNIYKMLSSTLISYLWLHLFVLVRGFIKPYDDGCRWLYDIVDSQSLAKEANLNPIKAFVNTTKYLNESIKVDFLNDRHKIQGEVRPPRHLV